MVFIIHKNYFCLALNFGLVLFITYTLPLLLTNLEFRSLFLIDLSELFIFIYYKHLKFKPGKVLLFHVLRQSTIGAERLDFRVRNGIGYYPFAKITRRSVYRLKLRLCKDSYLTLFALKFSIYFFKLVLH